MRYLLCLLLGLLAATGAQAAPPPPAPIAQPDLDRIGVVLLRVAPAPQGRLLFVARLDHGFMESRVLWHAPGATVLRELDPSAEIMHDLLVAALAPWEAQTRRSGQPRWNMLFVTLDNGRLSAEVARRPAVRDGRVWEDAEIARRFSALPIEALSFPQRPLPPVRAAGETVPTPADIERIRAGLVAAAGRSDVKILLFGRFGPDRAGFAIRFRIDGENEVRAADFPTESDPGLVEIWNAARERMGERVWREMIVIVERGVARVALRQPSDPDFHRGFSAAATEVERTEFPQR